MKQCPTCGSLNPDNADVCADCGMELPGQTATPPVATSSTTPESAPLDAAPAAPPLDASATSLNAPTTPPSDASSAPTPAPVEATGTDPFAGSEWNFGPDTGSASQTTPAVETPPVSELVTPEPTAPEVTPSPVPMEIAGAGVVEPAATPVATPVSPSGSGTAQLVLKRGGAPTGDVFTIGSSATVGRFDPESGPVDVDMAQLPEAVYISRHHAEIHLRDGQWIVKDLGSRNGTFVKNAAGFSRVTGETPVSNGDEIAFGNARFEFKIA